MLNIISTAHAQATGTGSFGDMGLMNMLPLFLIFIIMYFFLIRPQSKRAKEQREMISALKRGDRVLTSGGIIGTITKVVDVNEVVVEISKGVEVSLLKNSVTQVINKTVPGNSSDKTPSAEKTEVKKTQLIKKKTAGLKSSGKKTSAK